MSRPRSNSDQTVPDVPQQEPSEEKAEGQTEQALEGSERPAEDQGNELPEEQERTHGRQAVRVVQVVTYLRFYSPMLPCPERRRYSYILPRIPPLYWSSNLNRSHREYRGRNDANLRTVLNNVTNVHGHRRNPYRITCSNLRHYGLFNHLRSVDAVLTSQYADERQIEPNLGTSESATFAGFSETGSSADNQEATNRQQANTSQAVGSQVLDWTQEDIDRAIDTLRQALPDQYITIHHRKITSTRRPSNLIICGQPQILDNTSNTNESNIVLQNTTSYENTQQQVPENKPKLEQASSKVDCNVVPEAPLPIQQEPEDISHEVQPEIPLTATDTQVSENILDSVPYGTDRDDSNTVPETSSATVDNNKKLNLATETHDSNYAVYNSRPYKPIKLWANINKAKIPKPGNIKMDNNTKEASSAYTSFRANTIPKINSPLPEPEVNQYVPFPTLTKKFAASNNVATDKPQDNIPSLNVNNISDDELPSYRPFDMVQLSNYDCLRENASPTIEQRTNEIENLYSRQQFKSQNCKPCTVTSSDISKTGNADRISDFNSFNQFASAMSQNEKEEKKKPHLDTSSGTISDTCRSSRYYWVEDNTTAQPEDLFTRRQPPQQNHQYSQQHSSFFTATTAPSTITSTTRDIPICFGGNRKSIRRTYDQTTPNINNSESRLDNLPSIKGIYTFENYLQSNSRYQSGRTFESNHSSTNQQNTANNDQKGSRQSSLIIVDCQGGRDGNGSNYGQEVMNYENYQSGNIQDFGIYTRYSTHDDVAPTLDDPNITYTNSGTSEINKQLTYHDYASTPGYNYQYPVPDVISTSKNVSDNTSIASYRDMPSYMNASTQTRYHTNSYSNTATNAANNLGATGNYKQGLPMYDDPNTHYYGSNLDYTNIREDVYGNYREQILEGPSLQEAAPVQSVTSPRTGYSYYSPERLRQYIRERIEETTALHDQADHQGRYSNETTQSSIPSVQVSNSGELGPSTVTSSQSQDYRSEEASGNNSVRGGQGRVFYRGGRGRGVPERGRAIRGQRANNNSSNIRLI